MTAEGEPGFPASRPLVPLPQGVGLLAARTVRRFGFFARLPAAYAIVAIATGVIAVAFARSTIPPGVDPGHWLSIAYPYVGLPTAPDPTDRVLFYSPLMFPFLGGLVRATGSPLLGTDVFAVALVAAYGLSVALLARRFLAVGAFQVALVGVTMFSGATIQMVFWGGYPNLLGFLLMNATLVGFLRYVRSPSPRGAALFFGLFGVTYFAHDLSFTVLLVVLALASAFLLLLGRLSFRFLVRWTNLAGAAAVAAAIVGYGAVTAHLGIPHPSYYTANPAAYSIDEVGELFAPLARAPVLFPPGAPVYLPPIPTAVLLASAPVVALFLLALVRRARPGLVDTRLVIAGAWLAGALALPGAGYLAHVDTDYTRFLYFLPAPFLLVLLLALERTFLARLVPTAASSPAPAGVAAGRPRGLLGARRRPTGATVARAAVAAGLVLMFTLVTIPVAIGNQAASTTTAHDPAFVAAMQWLRSCPASGGVLTVQSAARWTEALALRDAHTVGPVWLLFDPFQIADAQESYWALTAADTVTNNQVALAYSGFATPVMSQAPMYTAYEDGIAFPVARLLPGSIFLNATGPTGTHNVPAQGAGTPAVAVASGSPASVTITYRSAVGTVTEVGVASPDGSASIDLAVRPDPGYTIHAVGFTLATPPSDSTTLATDTVAGVALAGTTLTWTVEGRLGQYPTPATVATSIAFSHAPQGFSGWNGGAQVPLVFPDPAGADPFDLGMTWSTPGASNPTRELPPLLDTPALLNESGIRFLLWPNTLFGQVEVAYYTASFGFRPAYANPEWTILER